MGAENLQDNLSKSLDEIEAAAEAILSKSEEVDAVDKQEELVEDAQKAKAVKKSVDADEVSDTDDDGNDDGEDEGKDDAKEDEDEGEDKAEKSLAGSLKESEEISKGVDASEFLSEFSRIQARVVDDLRFDVSKSLKTSARVSDVLSKSFAAIMKSQEGLVNLVKSQAGKLEESNSIIKSLQERLDVVEKTPVGRKAVVDVVEKSFAASAGIAEQKGSLSKGEVLAKINNMIVKGVPGVVPMDLIKYESTGEMSATIKDLVENN